MDCTEQIFVEWMKEVMFKHPRYEIDFTTFLGLITSLTISGSVQYLPSTIQILPYELLPLCGVFQLQDSSSKHLICLWYDCGQNADSQRLKWSLLVCLLSFPSCVPYHHFHLLGHESLVTVYIRILFRIVCVVVTSSFPAPEHLGVYLCSLKQFLSTCTSGSSSMNNSSCHFLINLKVNISIPRSWALQKLLANFRHLKSNNSFEMLL